MIFFIVIFIFYAIFISASIIGFQLKIPVSKSINYVNLSKEKLLTLIIPFRNEESRINNLLISIYYSPITRNTVLPKLLTLL